MRVNIDKKVWPLVVETRDVTIGVKLLKRLKMANERLFNYRERKKWILGNILK
jgi:hypothetical protein